MDGGAHAHLAWVKGNEFHLLLGITRSPQSVINRSRFGNSEAGSGKDRAADAAMGVWTYSGGWKMKMQLCAAQLVKADLLMLDEPTGSLHDFLLALFLPNEE